MRKLADGHSLENNLKKVADPVKRTLILNDAAAGSMWAQAVLAPLVYKKLRQMARRLLLSESSAHTFQATDLVHEAYLRLFSQKESYPKSQAHFFALAATMMRRVLINYAVARKAEKRGDGIRKLTLSAAEGVADSDGNSEVDVIALDVALTKLGELDERMSKIVELRYFGGMSIEDTALALDISPATVKRDWQMAKLWLKKELGE